MLVKRGKMETEATEERVERKQARSMGITGPRHILLPTL
jgi:hypothetical protein